MDESDLLKQRFVDNDLTPEERIRFLKALDQDTILRRRLLDTEMLIAEAGRLPRLAPSAGFTAQVLDRLPLTSPNLFRRLWDLLCAPHVLRWNLAGALVTACIMLVVVLVVGRAIFDRPPSIPVAKGNEAEPIALVRLILLQPQAASVAVAGDFNGWNPERTPLHRTEGGIWAATIPLKPGRYHYMYVVDGKQWVADPFASEESLDGFGSRNAVLDIEPPL